MTALTITLLFSAFVADSKAATYYVDANAGVDSASGDETNPKLTINAGLGLLSSAGGDTLIVRDGVYNESVYEIPSGVAGQHNALVSENDGGAIINGEIALFGGSYIEIAGFKVVFAQGGWGSGAAFVDHIKFRRMSFEGGPLQGNNYTFALGSNDYPTSDILIEDSWMYGPGGRQNLLIYRTDRVVIRRVVLRHDLGWSNTDKTDPEGVGTIYNANDVEIQNLIVVDSDLNPANVGSEWVGALTVTNNASSGGTNQDNNIRGTIVLNVQGNAFEHGGDGDVRDIFFEDVAVWWNQPDPQWGAALSMNNPSTKTVVAERMTIGNMGAATLWGGINSSLELRNSIVTGIQNFPIGIPYGNDGTITDAYNNCFGNQNENCSATGLVQSDPTQSGLLYITRIEDDSALLTSGEAGTRQGAVITNRIGVTGTYWGEPGYTDKTGESLWPWPYEARIQADMRGVDARGFAANDVTSLTSYIWEALGNPMPDDFPTTGTDTPTGTGTGPGATTADDPGNGDGLSTEATSACGCVSSTGQSGLAPVALLLLLIRRRRE